MLSFHCIPYQFVCIIFCIVMLPNIAFRRVFPHRISSPMRRYPIPWSTNYRYSSSISSPPSPRDQHKTNSIIDLNQPVESIKIPLLPVEENVFRLLQDFCDEKMVYVRIRVAGGWVRDKLLGLPSKYDIDFALENSTGAKFALALQDWLHEKGMNHMKLGVIQQNPEKSKHLETVAARYGDLSLDFVNLRTENYVENSRIPAMALGTPEEDAYRRDLTINALFYNIHTRQVEDFTKQGLVDLSQRIIRTPLPALVTFTDDPLRILRAIRFACRFNFTIAPDVLSAGSTAGVHSALVNKVSVERIWNEVKMMLVKSQSYPRAVALLYSLGLLPNFLRVPPTELFVFNGTTLESIEQVEARKMYHIAAISVMLAKYVQQRAGSYPLLDKVFVKVFDKADVQRNTIMSLLSFPWRDLHYKVTPLKKRSVNEYLLKEHLRVSGKDASFASEVHQAHIHTQDVLDILLHKQTVQAQPSEDFLGEETPYNARLSTLHGGETQQGVNKLQFGLLLMHHPDTFASSLLLAAVYSVLSELQLLNIKQPHTVQAEEKQLKIVGCVIARALHLSADDYPLAAPSSEYERISRHLPAVTERVLGKVEELLEVMEHFQFNLQDVSNLSLPMLNGYQLKQLLPQATASKPAIMGEMKAIQQKWRLCTHPNGKVEDLIAFLKKLYGA